MAREFSTLSNFSKCKTETETFMEDFFRFSSKGTKTDQKGLLVI